MRRVFFALALVSPGIAFGQLSVRFDAAGEGGQSYPASGVLLGDGRLATIAVVGADPAAMRIEGEDTSPVLELIVRDPVTGLAIYVAPASGDAPPAAARGETFLLTPGDALYLDESGKGPASRIVKWETSYGGRILPVALLRVHHPGEKPPLPGTPLFSKEGKLLALCHEAAPQFGNGTFALPVEAITRVEKDLARRGRIASCWIGVTINASDAVLAIEMVRPDSPGAKAGLRKGDILLWVGQRKVGSYGEARNAFFYLIAGESTPLQILRGTQRLQLSVVPEVHPALKRPEGSKE